MALALIAIIIRLFFWYYTDRTWEDALITVQHAENAAQGFGLTHTAGRPLVHGFTSPISVLVPLIGELLHRGFGLALIKLLSALCGGASVWLGMRIGQRFSLSRPANMIVGAYLAVEHHQILFGMAGMETQLVTTALLFSIYTLFDSKPWQVGVGLGLCMLARPDFFFWVAIVIGLGGYRSLRLRSFRPLTIILFALLAVYGPWLIFTTIYYGSPIPNTILAKAFGYNNKWYAGVPFSQVFWIMIWRVKHYIFGGLGPAYGGNGTGLSSFGDEGAIALAVLVFAQLGLRTARKQRDLPTVSMAVFIVVYAAYYMFLMNTVFGWYTVPLAAVVILASARGLDDVLSASLEPRFRTPVCCAIGCMYIGSLIAIAPVAFRGERDIQRYVEDGNRKEIGIYLSQVSTPEQTIGCEPLGYVGYYSRRFVYDYPGLCNRSVVQYMREHPGEHDLIDMLEFFHPDFLVLRPKEYEVALTEGWLQRDYTLLREFRVPEEKIEQLLFPERNIDLWFYVLKRNAAPPQPERK